MTVIVRDRSVICRTRSLKVSTSDTTAHSELLAVRTATAQTEAGEAPRQLKGFGRVELKPGESKTVTMSLSKESLAAWDEKNHDWKVYPGKYTVDVGASSRDIRYKGLLTIAN